MTYLLALMYLISRAELTGSRGRARYYGQPEPETSDYDWSIWTDNLHEMDNCRLYAYIVAGADPKFSVINRHDGFTLHSKAHGVDVNVRATRHRDVLRLAWALQETIPNKLEAWREAHRRLNYKCED